MDRLPGRLGNGARLLGRVRPLAELAVHLDPALPPLLRRPLRLAEAAADRQPRPAGPARLRRLPLLLQPGEHRALGAARLSGARLPAGAMPVDRLPRARVGAAADLADDVAAGRGALPDGLPGRAEHGRRGGDRRRLRGGHRRPQDRPRRTALRRLPRRHPLRRHLRPGQLRRLRAVRGDLALHRRMGRPARRPRRLDHLRHRHLHPAAGARDPDPPGTGGAPARRDPRLRLGRLPLHRLRARVGLQRRAGQRLTGGDAGLTGEAAVARRDDLARDLGQVHAADAGADAAHLRPGPVPSARRLEAAPRGGTPSSPAARSSSRSASRSSPSSSCSGRRSTPASRSSTNARSPPRPAAPPRSASGDRTNRSSRSAS